MIEVQLPEIITTDRLVLRSYRLSDVGAVLAHATDPEWAQYLPVPIRYGQADAEQFIARQILLDRSTNPSWATPHRMERVISRVGEYGRILHYRTANISCREIDLLCLRWIAANL